MNFTRDDPAYQLIKLQEAVYTNPPRPDMIFYRGLSLLDVKSVFNDMTVSDHVGILATFNR